ncbi:MAG: DUF2851 family protein [Kiritimatiellia bacterium]|nr:DUF2851 family protein [Kiritimatiellia bacterium]
MAKNRNMDSRFGAQFAGAARYTDILEPPVAGVREAPDSGRFFPYSERHLQCAWTDDRYRPEVLKTSTGDQALVVSPGRWNLESGPDFRDAVLILSPDQRRLQGDIEVHIHPRNWDHHGHTDDPAYRNVIAHITWFPGRRPAGLPGKAVQIALRDPISAVPTFSFDSLDLTAYPYAVPSRKRPPCGRALAGCDPELSGAILDAAGEERLRIKAVRMGERIRRDGPEQVLYEEIMAALGYKHNRSAFRALARAVTHEALTESCAGRPRDAYALLMGVAGLLPSAPQPQWDDEAARFVRALWNRWWRMQDAWSTQIMASHQWSLSGLRPQNHPARRLAAAAGMFAGKRSFHDALVALDTTKPQRWYPAAAGLITDTPAPAFWDHRLSWGRPPVDSTIALIGESRLNAMTINILVPFLAATGHDITTLLTHLPPESSNALTRQTAHALLGRDHNPALHRTGLRRQGLLQVFHDFCITHAADCQTCPFPEALEGFVGNKNA